MNDIKTYLSSTNQTVAEFAAKAGISAQSLYKYINGERTPRKNHYNKMVLASDGVLDASTFFPTPDITSKTKQNRTPKQLNERRV